jgi:hypothetical protein
MMSSIGNTMGTYEGNKKRGGRRGDIIKLINLHLLYHYSFFFSHIFKTTKQPRTQKESKKWLCY